MAGGARFKALFGGRPAGRLRTDLVRSILLWVDLDAFRELERCLDFMDISSMKIDAASSKLF